MVVAGRAAPFFAKVEWGDDSVRIFFRMSFTKMHTTPYPCLMVSANTLIATTGIQFNEQVLLLYIFETTEV